MVNMKMSAEEAKEYSGLVSEANAPEYPYGLMIDLNDDSLEKLGIKDLPAVGAEMTLMARVVVTRVSSNQTQGGEAEACVGLQITDMELNRPAGGSTMASRLYGG